MLFRSLQDVLRTLNDRGIPIEQYPVTPEKMARLMQAIEGGKVDTSQGKQALSKLLSDPAMDVDAAIESLGIVQVDSSELEQLCRSLLEEFPDVVEKVKGGNAKAIAAIVGPAKKKNKNADPRQIQEICLKLISQS